MNKQQLAEVKQALEALTVLLDEWTPARQAQLKGMEAVKAIKQALAAPVQEPWGYLEIDDIESQREYPHNCRNVNLWHEGGEGMTAIYIAPPVAQPAFVQEPVAIVVAAEYEDGSTAGHRLEWRGRNEANDFPEGTEFYTAPQPVPVKTYHDGKPWPVAPKPWVGLTDAEVMQTMSGDWTSQFYYFARAIESKLREKNT